MGTIGPRLKAAREARNLSVEQAADDTRISLRFLQALEREEFEALPAPVYVRGFLRSYANYLGLEPQSLLSELEGGNGFEKGPSAYVRGPENRARSEPRPATDPFRPRPVAPVPAPGEWNPEPQKPVVEEVFEAPSTEYRPRPVPGVLVERGYSGGDSRLPIMVLLGGVVAIVVLVGLIAIAALNDGGGNQLAAGSDDDDDEEATATLTGGGGQTIVVVETPTPATTPEPGAEATNTAEPGATQEPTETVSGAGNTPVPGATATATLTPTQSPTPAPTATPVPPTATPTELPFHPTEFQECTAAGLNDCGPGDLLVICGPRGWFVDYNPAVEPFPNPGWPTFTYTGRLFDLNGIATASCQ